MITLNKIASLQKQSKDTLSVFEKTVARLTKINTAIKIAKDARAEKISKLQGEISSLEVAERGNLKVVDKLCDFLEV